MDQVFTALLLSLPLIGAYGIFAIGIVLIYRASRMLNLAHGAMAMVPAYLLYALVGARVSLVLALPAAVAGGAILGLAVEKIFVSRLRSEGPTAQTVGTVAVLGILVALIAQIFGTASLSAVRVFPAGRVKVGLSSIQYGELGLFAVMLAIAGALFLLVHRTDLGLMMRGTAESRLAASLMGVNPDRLTSFTWALGGAMAALAGIMLAAVTVLHPYTLALQVLPAFIAALLGGLGSLGGVLLGALVVGATQGLVPLLGEIGKVQGAPQLFLAALAIVVMAVRGRRIAPADSDGTVAESGDVGGVPRDRRWSTRKTLAAFALLAVVIFIPSTPVPSSVIAAANLAASYTVVAIAIVVLTGWVGQISLGHAALVGVGSYVTGHVVAGLGIPFPLSLPFAAAAAGVAAALLGAVALRVRGLYLAVATLIFSWMASEFLFRQQWFIEHSSIPHRPIGFEGTLPFFDFTDRGTFYLVAWATVAIVVFAAANLRDSKTGRAFFAIRGSEMAAASLGIDVMRYKLIAFAASGAIAGVAGNLIMSGSRVVSPDQFTFSVSLFFLAIAVVGGLHSLPGAVASGLLFGGLTEVFYRVEFLGRFLELVSGMLLAVVLLAYRGGLASLPGRVRQALVAVYPTLRPIIVALRRKVTERKPSTKAVKLPVRPRPSSPVTRSRFAFRLGRKLRRPPASHQGPERESLLNFKAALEAAVAEEASAASYLDEASEDGKIDENALEILARTKLSEVRPKGTRQQRLPLIEAERVTVRFGGLTAVDDASLTVREGEIVGLIGPNGAGKTTLFNAIAGYNDPASGVIQLYGKDVSRQPVHRRARIGVARTFQLLQLFRQLSVYQNLLVATHVHNPTGFPSHVTATYRSIGFEREAKRRVLEILELLELEELADTRAGDLPFGILRMVEVARALVTGFRVMMLDEPASGLDNTETDRLMEVIRFVRGLGVTILLIEHDVRMVTGVSDYMYVLDQGKMISEGTPEEIQKDPKVIAAYLGESEKGKEREEALT